ncbi:MAG: TrbC/VirB2 family protein [Hyphomonadaceae bacterium]
MTSTTLERAIRVLASSAIAAALFAGAAHAATGGGGMPWEGPLTAIMDSITGPVARIIAILIIVATGLTLAFGDVGQGFKKLIQILFGLAITFAAASFFLPLVGGSGALVP